MKTTLLSALLLFSFTAFCQTNFRFADSTAQWNVLSISGPHQQSYTYLVAGDTVIGNYQYQLIKCSQCFPLAIGPIRRDTTGKVFTRRSNSSSDVLIYDFGALPNDTFPLFTYSIPYLNCAINSVDSIFLDRWRKKMLVTYFSDSFSISQDPPLVPYSANDVWIEGIGALNTPFYLPGFQEIANFGGPLFSLLCFSENSSTVYRDSHYNTCIITDISSPEEEEVVNVFPNPCDLKTVTVNATSFESKAYFKLFDISGRVILEQILMDKTTQIDLTEISKGLYLYTISTGEQKLASGKLAVQ
jgi:hypothetical protein